MDVMTMFRDSGLHDYEFVGLSVNYYTAKIVLQLKAPRGDTFEITIDDFTFLQMNREEKWGSGIYITASDLDFDSVSNVQKIKLLLNSGDEIQIHYTTSIIKQ